jgi:hypothetical protein
VLKQQLEGGPAAHDEGDKCSVFMASIGLLHLLCTLQADTGTVAL